MAPDFIPGLQLAREFYADVVGPLLAERFPGLRYAAALLGPGSEVAGLDSERSTDHNWGPRLQVLLSADDPADDPDDPGGGSGGGSGGDFNGGPDGRAAAVTAMLTSRLPSSFRGYPVAFPLSGEPDSAARHHVVVSELGAWLTGLLGFDPRRGVTLLDWLATPTQRLAEFTAGAVFRDDPGELTRARRDLAWYPRDVWLYLLACQWRRIEQEEAFPGRCAEAGDDLGSVIVTARLARDLMRLCLLMHRRYPPYSKWLGTASARLPGSPGPSASPSASLAASLSAALSATGWPAREQHLGDAYRRVAARHNQLGLTPPLDTGTRPFYDRPYQVIEAARFTTALRAAISDPRIAALPLTGAVDQFTDSTDAAGDLPLLRACVAAAIRGDPA